MIRMKRFFCWVIPGILLAGCQMVDGNYSYKKMVEQELASGKTADRLLLAIRFGMSRKEFYDYCWEMHNKGQFEDGSNSTAVLFKVHSGLKHNAFMNFFPDFYKDSIYKMWAKFQYEAW